MITIRVLKYISQGTEGPDAERRVTERIGQKARGYFSIATEGCVTALFDDDDEVVLYKGEWEEVR